MIIKKICYFGAADLLCLSIGLIYGGNEMPVVSLGKAEVILTDWNILVVKDVGDTVIELFMGFSVHDRFGRLSTQIEKFDPENRTGTTFSGSTYSLIGEPGLPHDDALYVLEHRIGKVIVERELFSDQSMGILTFKYPLKNNADS